MNTRLGPASPGPAGRHRPRTRVQVLHSSPVMTDRGGVALPMCSAAGRGVPRTPRAPVLRVHVAGSLWLDSPEERGFANLRSALWRIHRSGLDLVESRGDTLQLAAGVRVDLADATALARRLIGSVPMGAGADVDWGPLSCEVLPDWDEDWALVEREHFRNLSLQALESLCEHLTAQGRLRRALEVGLAAFGCDPLRETAHRLLIRTTSPTGTPSTRCASSGSDRSLAAHPARDRAVAADVRPRAGAAPRRVRPRSPRPDRGCRPRDGDAAVTAG